jgi:hypothetical protein
VPDTVLENLYLLSLIQLCKMLDITILTFQMKKLGFKRLGKNKKPTQDSKSRDAMDDMLTCVVGSQGCAVSGS